MADVIPTTVVDNSQDPVALNDLPAEVNAFKVTANGRILVRVRNDSGATLAKGFDPVTAEVIEVNGLALVLPFEIAASSLVEFSGPIAI